MKLFLLALCFTFFNSWANSQTASDSTGRKKAAYRICERLSKDFGFDKSQHKELVNFFYEYFKEETAPTNLSHSHCARRRLEKNLLECFGDQFFSAYLKMTSMFSNALIREIRNKKAVRFRF